ncbi:hypothetical protein L1987_63290 [Smallanthus sonchifolius]|uniref:Uncharacterized protein n=1 Tax=Smallanthus sonchifolius TaxID=185202 RepID=A0ACB9CD36_9ASTR|nr:hypothetical protein L1987_63290 [Smallanthus sonchifolius]
MFTLAGKLVLCLSSFIFIHLIHTTTLAQPDLLYHICENTANYTANSTYQRNLNTALSTLPTTNNGFGFYNLSTGQGNDTVNSVALCRGDVNPDVCRSCLNDSVVMLRRLCPNQKEAVGYYDNCLLKYSNEVILGNIGRKIYVYLANTQNSTDIDGFNGALGPLLRTLRVDAAAGGGLEKFASGNTTGPGFSTIYGLVQCTPDLSELQCSDCLEDIINRIALYFNGKVGGRILLPMCNFRYETYRFVNQNALVVPPSPPPVLQPSPPVPPPPPGKKNNTTRIVIIITVVVIVTIVILIASLCIFMRLRKKKRQTTSPPAPESVQSKRCLTAWKSWKNGTAANIIDPTLKTGSGSLRDIIRSIHIGLLCVQENIHDRPTMAGIVLMLNSFTITLPVPAEPAFFMHSNINPEMPLLQEDTSSTGSNGLEKSKISKSRSRSSQYSVNDVSISDFVPR